MALSDELLIIINQQESLIEQQKELIHDLGEIIKTYGRPTLIVDGKSIK
jgi:hypothetical protein